MMITAASGVIRQTCTAITDAMASPGLPSQYMLDASPRGAPGSPSSDSCRSTQSIGEKIESSIHNQAMDDSATGVVQGSRTRNRTTHLPLKSATRMFRSEERRVGKEGRSQ